MIGFGIDLAGYTTGRTSVAAIEAEGRVAKITLLRNSSLSRKRSSADSAEQAVRDDADDLRRCLKLGPVAVDIPIDLQGLPGHAGTAFIWSLTRRPVDRVLDAMPPLADRIGAPVARFAAIMRSDIPDDALGCSLFETYPAATWRKLGIFAGRYKAKDGQSVCAALCDQLRLKPHIDNHDDLDAAVCAITAAAPAEHICSESDLALEVGRLPRGFRLLKRIPFDAFEVSVAEFEPWMAPREQ